MTEISKKNQPERYIPSGRWPIDQDGRPLMGKQIPTIGKRERIAKKVCLDTLGWDLDESNQEVLKIALGNRKERFDFLENQKNTLTQYQWGQDAKKEQDVFNSLNKIIQAKRSHSGFDSKKTLRKLRALYALCSPWWHVKQEIIFRTAEILVEK